MIKQFITNDACLRCKGCCRFSSPESAWSPNLLCDEPDLLTRNNLDPACFTQEGKFRLIFNQKENVFVCPALDVGTNRCTVYAVRPFECQLYPFLIHRQAGSVWLAVDTRCPFLEQHLKDQECNVYVQNLAEMFNTPSIRSILEKNPSLIQEYDAILPLVKLNL